MIWNELRKRSNGFRGGSAVRGICLYRGPGGIIALTTHSALFLILLADDCCEFWGREKRILWAKRMPSGKI